MTAVEVIVTGIIMLLRGSTIGFEPTNAMRAAIAVEDIGPRIGTYGVQIPSHEARLVVPSGDAFLLFPSRRVRQLTAPAEKDTNGNVVVAAKPFHVVSLKGDRIQFGTLVVTSQSSTCVPLAIDRNAAGLDPLPGIPDMRNLTTSARLVSDALPKGNDYSNISPLKVAAWLDFHSGAITANFHLGEEPIKSEFRPTRHVTTLPDTVSWKFSGDSLCVSITPFSATKPDVVFKLNASSLQIGFQNVPIDDLTDVHPGTSFDYELFYDVLASKPCPPPLPHAQIGQLAAATPVSVTVKNDEFRRLRPVPVHNPHGDDESGENCGPNQNGG